MVSCVSLAREREGLPSISIFLFQSKDFDSSGFGQRHLHLKFKVSIFSNRWLEKRVDLYARVGIMSFTRCVVQFRTKNTAHYDNTKSVLLKQKMSVIIQANCISGNTVPIYHGFHYWLDWKQWGSEGLENRRTNSSFKGPKLLQVCMSYVTLAAALWNLGIFFIFINMNLLCIGCSLFAFNMLPCAMVIVVSTTITQASIVLALFLIASC